MGTQKNRLNETVRKTYVQTDGLENIYNFTLKNFVYLNLCNFMLKIFAYLEQCKEIETD